MLRNWFSNRRRFLWRGLYLVAVFAFTLPFVTVYTTSCVGGPLYGETTSSFVRTGEVRDYYGFQLITKEVLGWLYALPIALGLLFLALTFLRLNGAEVLRGFWNSWRAVLSSLSAILVSVLPQIQFLTHDVEARIGQRLAVASWALVYVATLTGALISLVNTRRSGELRGSDKPVRFASLLAAHVIIALPAIAISVYSIFLLAISPFENVRDSAEFSAVVTSLAVPICLGAYFLDKGLKGGKSWAVRSGRWAIFLLALGVVLGLVVGIFYPWIRVMGGLLVWWVISSFLVGVGGIVSSYLEAAKQVEEPPV